MLRARNSNLQGGINLLGAYVHIAHDEMINACTKFMLVSSNLMTNLDIFISEQLKVSQHFSTMQLNWRFC